MFVGLQILLFLVTRKIKTMFEEPGLVHRSFSGSTVALIPRPIILKAVFTFLDHYFRFLKAVVS